MALSDLNHDNWKILGSIGAILSGCAAWLLKHRPSETGSWISRRINTERLLISANQTIANQQQQIRIRDAEISYLMGSVERAQSTAELIQKAVATFALKSATPPDGSTNLPLGSNTLLPRSLTNILPITPSRSQLTGEEKNNDQA